MEVTAGLNEICLGRIRLGSGGGVKLAGEYVQYLKDEIKRQEESNQLKIDYMKKLKNGR